MNDLQRRQALVRIYESPSWTAKVKKMSDAQVFAAYTRITSLRKK